MRKAALIAGVVAVAGLCSASTWAAQPYPLEKVSPEIVAAARYASFEQRQTLTDQLPDAKAVSRTDKLTVDLTGTIHSGTIYTDDGGCGYGAGNVLVLFLRVKGQWVSVACGGAAFNACASTKPGQRIRVQGALIAAPDILDPDFNECDPTTWVVGPINFLFATKVTK